MIDLDSSMPDPIPGGVEHLVEWDITTGTSDYKDADLDGVLIQKVTIEFEIYVCEDDEKGNEVLKPIDEITLETGIRDVGGVRSPYVYWEGWIVSRGDVGIDFDDFRPFDIFNLSRGNIGGIPNRSCGRFSQKGEATFYQGADMPEQMKPRNVEMAGVLYSTFNDPEPGLRNQSVQGPRAGAFRSTTISWNRIGSLCEDVIGPEGGVTVEESVAYPVTWLGK